MYSLEETYNQAIRISRNIVEDIRFGRKLYLEPIDLCSIQICKYLHDTDNNILSFINSVKDKNPYLIAHPVNVALISFVIGKWLSLDERKLKNLVRAALLHDIGKAKIKDSILNKEDSLTLEEIERLKAHPVIGYRILEKEKIFDMEVLQAVLFHHERMDSSGYPLGLKEEKINLLSRIIAIADTFDAITVTQSYSKGKSPLQAIAEIQANSSNHMDNNICRIFVTKSIEYYCGREIKLSNEQIGSIVYINPADITKPLIQYEDKIHDLSIENDIKIVEIL